MIYSHRSTDYSLTTFPSRLHFHDYYELVLFIRGDIRYICESDSCLPKYGDVVIIPPGKLHMSMITAEQTGYERHVFYLYPDAFDAFGGREVTRFMTAEHGRSFLFSLGRAQMEEVVPLLDRLEAALSRGLPEDRAVAQAYTLQIFYLMNQSIDLRERADAYLPQNMIDIQQYLDEHFTEISSVSEVAAHFFYSREYVSRLFKRYFNTTVAEYILNRRILYSQKLMESDLTLIEICFQSGFGSVSAFIRAFQRITGLSPSRYRRSILEKDA